MALVLLTAGWLARESRGGDGGADGLEAIRRAAEAGLLAASEDNTAWIDAGRAVVVGSDEYGQCATGDWSGMAAVALGAKHAVGLTSDGTLRFAGDNSLGQCALTLDGRRALAIAASSYATYAVLEDGSVAMSGSGPVDRGTLGALENVASIAAGETYVAVLYGDGTAAVLGDETGECDVSDWKNLISIDCGYDAVIGLEADGTVRVTGRAGRGQRALDGMRGARFVAAGGNFCLAVRRDGTVCAAGSNGRGQCEVSDWTNVERVACGYIHAVGETGDGRRLYAGAGDWEETS